MSENLIEQLQKLLTQKKSKAYYAKRLNISESEVDELLKELRGGDNYYIHADLPLDQEFSYTYTTSGSRRENLDKGTLETTAETDYEPKSVDELVALHKVDVSKYKVSSYWTKQRGDKFFSSLFCTLLKPSEFNPEKFSEYIKGYKSPHKAIQIKKSSKSEEEVDVEISLTDVHLDKRDLNVETVEERKTQYMQVLQELLGRLSSFYVNKIVFVIGGDIFHTDTFQGTTTKGTPVDISTTWFDAYEQGFDLLVKAISLVKEHCESVEVILVQGNHDRTKSYYVAHALELYFQNDNVLFDREASNVKHAILGNTFVGYHHGNCKMDDLPLIFATSECSKLDFGYCEYQEVHTGDKHHYLTKEIKGVRIQQLPSLAGTDQWHSDMNFINNIRAGLALVYSPSTGKCGEFEARIKK